jgi:hypothetical protein
MQFCDFRYFDRAIAPGKIDRITGQAGHKIRFVRQNTIVPIAADICGHSTIAFIKRQFCDQAFDLATR